MLPMSSSRIGLGSFCEDINGRYVIRVSKYGGDGVSDVKILVNGQSECQFSGLTPGSSRVCLVESSGNIFTYEVR